MAELRIAESDEDLRRCFPVMRELRTHLEADEFLERVRRQEREGYRILCVEEDGDVQALAGFRTYECLSGGRCIYVDDLVTAERARSRGHGKALLDWLVAHGREGSYDHLMLDSGVQRHDAHRFYFRERMHVSSHHFSRPLGSS